MVTGDIREVAKHPGRIPTTTPAWLEKKSIIPDPGGRLAAANTLDILLESLTRQAVEILKARFSKIVTLEPGDGFSCRAVYPAGLAPRWRLAGRPEPPMAQAVYREAVLAQDVVFIHGIDILDENQRRALKINQRDQLCLLPLNGSSEVTGLFVLCGLQVCTREQLRLVALIADQAAGCIYRSSLAGRLAESQLATVLALAKTLEARDAYTSDHSKNMSDWAERTAIRMNLSLEDVQAVNWAALLHDIGKIGIPDNILNRPGPLTAEEWTIMRRHPAIGAEIVLIAVNLAQVARLIRHHHEKFDSSGYPDGLRGEDIPLGARILAVVDSYSAMLDGRVYQAARTHQEAAAELQRWSGIYYDPQVVKAFLSLFE